MDSDSNIINSTNSLTIKLTSDSTLIAVFEYNEIDLTMTWDQLPTATPGDTISLIARIDHINQPIVADIDFSINMDYKLFWPTALSVMKDPEIGSGWQDDDTGWQSIDFDYIFSDGVSATISNYELATGNVFLRLEGIALASYPIETAYYFDKFDLSTDSWPCSNITLSEGTFSVAYCNAPARGSIQFQPQFSARFANIVGDNFEVSFLAEGDLSLTYEITGLSGTSIVKGEITIPKGTSFYSFDVNHLANGRYYFRFSNPFNRVRSFSFIKL